MKKLSVLLVILLLATPLLAYGLTVDRDEGGIPLQTVFYSRKAKDGIEKTPTKLVEIQEETGEPGEEDLPPFEDPFFPEPDGFKGTVVEINTTDDFIIISNVRYYNNYTQTYEFAESYKIVFNIHTNFIINGESGGSIHSIILNETIVAVGEADYESKIVKNAISVYQGELVTEEEWKEYPINGFIKSINRESNSFSIQDDRTMRIYTVTIDENTQFLKDFINNQNERDAELVSTGVIPSEFSMDHFCTVFAKVNKNLEATAFDVLIINTDHS